MAPLGVFFVYWKGKRNMDTRVAIIGIIVEDEQSVSEMNQLLHVYRDIIIGRMGLPYRSKDMNIVSIVVDALENQISSLAGKLGALPGISAKAVYSKRKF